MIGRPDLLIGVYLMYYFFEMDSELINGALVYGDNPDPLELEFGEEGGFQNDGQLLLANRSRSCSQFLAQRAKTIDSSTEKAEIDQLREELLRMNELNRTITTSYKQMLVNKARRIPTKQDPKRRLCAILQEELEEKTIICNKITVKMNNYKRKYQALRATIGKGSDTNSSADYRDLSMTLIEKENSELKQEISSFKANEARLEARLKLTESKLQSLTNMQCMLGNNLLIEKIKAKGGIFRNDADKIVDSISKLKQMMDDIVSNTPSTNCRDDEGLNIEVPYVLESANDDVLGKRECIVDSSSYQKEIDENTEDEMFGDTLVVQDDTYRLPEAVDQHPEPKIAHSSSEEAMQTEKKKPFKVDNGSSDDEEESSLSYGDVTIHLIDKKLGQLAKKGHQSNLYYGSEPFKRRIEDKTSPQKLPEILKSKASSKEDNSTAPNKHESSSMMLDTPFPAIEPVKNVYQPMLPSFHATTVCHKASIPSFLTRPAPKEKPCDQPTAIDISKIEVVAPKDQSIDDLRQSDPVLKPVEVFFKTITEYLGNFKISASSSNDQKNQFLSILRNFKEQTSSLPHLLKRQDRKSLLELLMQKDLKTETYLLKDVLKGQSSQPDSKRVYQLFVFQNIFFIIFISCFSDEILTADELENAAYFIKFRNPSPFLAEKFDKLCEIVSSAKAKADHAGTSSAREDTQNGPEKRHTHHFPLIKIVFNHLIYIMESISVTCNTEDDFCSAVLAKKMNLGELKDSCHYVVEKLARTPVQFDFLADLPDYLSSLKLLFLFARSINFNMSRIYYDGLRGVFANRKYRNSAQQLVACLILRQLNSLDQSN